MAKTIKIPTMHNNYVIDLAFDTIAKGKQAIVFVNSKRGAEKSAEEIAHKIKGVSLLGLSEKVLRVLSRPTRQCQRLSKCVKKGIAFHHAGLTHRQKEIIEDEFKSGKIKIICATPTLAAGVDMPAFRTILKDLRRYSGFGLNWIPTLEYLQMAGRAGRPSYDNYGEAIAIATTQTNKEEIYDRYVNGEVEEIYSKLAVEPVLRTYLLSLIATNFVNRKKEIIEFFKKTFWAQQFKDMEKLIGIIEKMLRLLVDYNFIERLGGSDFVSADEIEDEKFSATLIGKRVAELYIDPMTANYLIKCLQKAMKKEINAFSFLQMVSHTVELRPLLRVKPKDDFVEEAYVYFNENILEEDVSTFSPEYTGFLSSIKTALFFLDWINEKDEEFLLDKFSIRPGETRVKLDKADWLLYASEELARILKFQKLIKEIVKLRYRLKSGVKEELLALLKLKNIGRVRARKLFRNRVRSLGDVKKVDVNRLVQILGKKIAIDVKKQVGQDVSQIKVKERKRKGQISLMDF